MCTNESLSKWNYTRPLSKVLSSSLVDEKNIIGRDNPTRGGQPDSSTEIDYQQS